MTHIANESAYITLTIHHHHGDEPGETQFYVTKNGVTPEQVLSGEPEGIVCLCFEAQMATTITTLLNGAGQLNA